MSNTTRMFGKPHLYNVIYEQCDKSLGFHLFIRPRENIYKHLENEIVPLVLFIAREID